MPLNLHPDCKNRLKQELAQQLETIKVNNKSFVDRTSTAGFLSASNALPKHGPVMEHLERFIGEWPLYDFLYGYLSKELQEEQEYDSSVPVCALTEIEKYTDAEAAADRLVKIFDDLPWRYTFSLKLPAFPSSVFEEGADHYQLSDTLCLVKPSDNLVQEYPLQSGIEGRDKWLFGKGLLSIFFCGRVGQ